MFEEKKSSATAPAATGVDDSRNKRLAVRVNLLDWCQAQRDEPHLIHSGQFLAMMRFNVIVYKVSG